MESFRIVTLIRRLHHAIRTEIADEVRAHGFEGITPSHIYVFQTPGPDGVRPTELAQRTLMTKQAMNHLLAGLEAGGYLDRTTGPGDGRARILQLTPKGRALTEVIQRSASDIERRWSGALGSRRMQDLISTLAQLDEVATGELSESSDRGRSQAAF